MSGDATWCDRLRGDRTAVAAIEFAVIAPVMVLLIMATVELVNFVRIQMKLNVAAGQLVEMIAGQTSVTMASYVGPGGSLGDMCTAASYNLLPYDTSTLSAYIESTTVVPVWGGLGLSQDWGSDRSCPASHPAGSFSESSLLTNFSDTPRSLFTLDGSSRSSGGTIVRGYSAITLQLTYVYRNVLPFFLGPSITFTAIGSARPRSNTTITCTYPSGNGTANCPGVY